MIEERDEKLIREAEREKCKDRIDTGLLSTAKTPFNRAIAVLIPFDAEPITGTSGELIEIDEPF